MWDFNTKLLKALIAGADVTEIFKSELENAINSLLKK